MSKRYFTLLAITLLLPLVPLYGQQCETAAPVACVDADMNGRCLAKIPFRDSTVRFEAGGTCTVSATACALPPNKLNLSAVDLEAQQGNEQNALIQTQCQLYTGRNKCIVYDITHTGCSGDVEITIFASTENLSVAPRICKCEDVQQCQRGTELATAGVNGFWPMGTDPVSRRDPGGGSDYWWCNQVPGTGLPAVFGGFQLPSSCTKGSTCPIKFTLFDTMGNFICNANVLLSIQLVTPCATGFCPVNPLFPGSSEATNPPPLVRCVGSHYQFNWTPSESGTYLIILIPLNFNVPQQSAQLVVR